MCQNWSVVIRAVLLKACPKFYKICFMTYLSTTLFERVRDNTYITLKEIQAGHEKGRSMVHKDLLNPQNYLKTNKLNNKQVSLLFNLRNQCVRGIKDNFHGYYNHSLKCDLCNNETDTQDHLLKCHVLKQHIQWNHEEVKYKHIYGTLQQQITVTILISALLEVWELLLEEQQGLLGL